LYFAAQDLEQKKLGNFLAADDIFVTDDSHCKHGLVTLFCFTLPRHPSEQQECFSLRFID